MPVPSRLGRTLDSRAKSRHVRIKHGKHDRDRRGAPDGVHRAGLRVGAAGELDLPVDGHALRGAGGHAPRRTADEVEQRGDKGRR